MAFKNVKSTNPVKAPVVKALKELTGGQKVTSVQEDETSFRANVFKSLGGRQYEALGNHTVTKAQLFEMGLLPLPTSEELVDPATQLSEATDELEQVADEAETAAETVTSGNNAIFG